MSFGVRNRYAWMAMPTRALFARERLKRAMVGSTYGDPSMSIQTKLPTLLGALDQAIHVALAEPAIEIESELRWLDRDVRVEPGRRDLVEHLEIVLRDLLELLRLRQVLAEARQDGVDAELLLFLRRQQRIFDRARRA